MGTYLEEYSGNKFISRTDLCPSISVSLVDDIKECLSVHTACPHSLSGYDTLPGHVGHGGINIIKETKELCGLNYDFNRRL